MYSGGSVVGKAALVDPEILSTLPLIFTRGQKCQLWRCFQHQSTSSRPR